MPKPVCVPCGGFYRPEKNGIIWQENKPDGADTETLPARERQGWNPYKIWIADKWKCPGCGHEIIVGHGRGPVAEHYQSNFTQWAPLVSLQVNDC